MDQVTSCTEGEWDWGENLGSSHAGQCLGEAELQRTRGILFELTVVMLLVEVQGTGINRCLDLTRDLVGRDPLVQLDGHWLNLGLSLFL